VIDGAGNIVVTDGVARVWLVAESSRSEYGQSVSSGDLYAIAGTGGQGFSGDGGPATDATFFEPTGLALDPSGNLVISDLNNNRIRVLAASTGMYYGQAMTAGDVYTVAGDGNHGYSGDGGSAADAAFAAPESLLFTPAGNLVVADDIRIREISY
jgi:secreted PhoX family phosphatase